MLHRYKEGGRIFSTAVRIQFQNTKCTVPYSFCIAMESVRSAIGGRIFRTGNKFDQPYRTDLQNRTRTEYPPT